MLATLIVLHLVAGQAGQPARADDNPYEQAPAEQGAPNAPLPSKAGSRPAASAAPTLTAAPPTSVPPAAAPISSVATRAPAPPPGLGGVPQLSLLSANTLGGNAALLASAGWYSLGIAYGQGLTASDDLGGSLDLDYAKTELRLGAFWRHGLGTAGPFDMAGRLGLAWFANFGSRVFYGDNHYDRGVEVQPALVLSKRGPQGVVSLAAELPLTVTTKYQAGLLFLPRIAASYEAQLYEELTVGVRAALGYRAGSGSAPLSDGRGDLQFLVLMGYRAL